jgi:sialic acid synthase SpsE
MIIAGRRIGEDEPPFIVCEISSSHRGSLATAKELIREAKKAGADSVKFQCFLPGTITCDSSRPEFIIEQDGPWKGRRLWDLYTECVTPRDWFPELYGFAKEQGLIAFSTVCGPADVDFLESLGPDVNPAYKVSSFEIVNLDLIAHIASTGKPAIFSTGMAADGDIEAAIDAFQDGNAAILHCVSKYPAPFGKMNMGRLGDFHSKYLWTGLSDHSTDARAATMAVALGATIFEKHVTLTPGGQGPDDAFAVSPHVFREYCQAIRSAWEAMHPRVMDEDAAGSYERYRPSIRAIRDIEAGERFTRENIAVIRPGGGLGVEHLPRLFDGHSAPRAIEKGVAITWEIVA